MALLNYLSTYLAARAMNPRWTNKQIFTLEPLVIDQEPKYTAKHIAAGSALVIKATSWKSVN